MDIIAELLIKERDSILKDIEKSQLRLKQVEAKINELNILGTTTPILNERSENYIVSKTALNLRVKSLKIQALEVIKNKGRFLHKTEIASELKQYYPDWTDKKLDQRLATELGKSKNEGIIIGYKYADSNKSFVWGSVKWFENGKILPQYQYNTLKNENQTIVEF